MKALDRKQLKQVIVLGVLFLAVIAYTVFQLFFTGSTGASTKGTAATTSASGPAEGEQEQQTTTPSWLTSNEPARDPFVVPPQFDNLRQNRSAAVRTASPRVASAPNIGALPPMPVVPVSGSAGGSIGPPSNDSAAPSPPSPESSIAVTGIVIGDYPVAILRGASGNQRIAQPGHLLEGGYVLRAVAREGIVLEKDGKTVTLRPGGNPNAK